ncbi:hypothetical protein F4777DRAFT_134350 [Nemania sp. FL0916]|nr:hypothetical protein F4777DRAFT_134350 [Nemania sp. FL0916]
MAELMLKELGWVVTEAFDKLLDIERLNEQLNSIDVISELERFQLWAQNLGLFQDGHASLDYRVRDAAFVKDRLAELLRELMEHVRELSLILSGERQPAEKIDMPVDDSSSSSGSSSQMSTHSELSSSASSFHEVEFRFNSLTERLDALYSLATKIRNPKNRPSLSTNHLYKHVPEQDRVSYICDREEIEANVVSYILRQHIIESPGYKNIRDSHGEAIESFLSKHTSHDSWIIRRTGKANARRKQQLLYWKDHALRLGQAKMNTSQIARPTIVDREAAPNQHNLTHFLDGAQRIVPSLTTSATKLPTQKLDDLKSTISHQSRQSTVISVHNDVINWPPPPTKRGKGRYFECPYCRTFCPIRYLEKRAWETHIIHDLQAYHCTYERCQDPNRLYGSRQEWIDHESQHTRVWICQEHDEEFETQPDYTDHLKAKHPELQSDRISEVLIAIAVGSSTQVYRDCPFCPSGFNDNLEMQQHIELHLWRLALLALPPIANDSNDNDESVQSFDSHQAQQLGRTGSIIGDFGFKHGEYSFD